MQQSRILSPIVSTAILALAGTLIVACASSPDQQPDISTTPTATTELSETESSTFGLAIDCDQLLTALDTDTIFGADLSETTVMGAGLGDYSGTASGALRREGGVLCRWDNTATGADLQVLALPNAVDSWAEFHSEVAVFQPQQGLFGSESYFACLTGCRADVLNADCWVSIVINGTTTDSARDVAINEIVALIAGAEMLGEPAPKSEAQDCEVLFSADNRTAVLGAALNADNTFAPLQPVLLHAALVQSGGTHCYWRGDIGGVAHALTIVMLPDSASAWQSHWGIVPDPAVAPVEWADTPSIGDEAQAGCFTRLCFLAILDGELWLNIDVLDDQGNEIEQAIAIAEQLLTSLQ